MIAAPALLEYEALSALRYSRAYSVKEFEESVIPLNLYGSERYELKG